MKRSPGVAGALWRSPFSSRKGWSPAGPRRAEEAVPEVRPDPHHAAQPGVGRPEADRAPQPAEVRQQVGDDPLPARIDAEGEEDRRLGQRREDVLGLGVGIVRDLRIGPARLPT
jgi:hypothetical protein